MRIVRETGKPIAHRLPEGQLPPAVRGCLPGAHKYFSHRALINRVTSLTEKKEFIRRR